MTVYVPNQGEKEMLKDFLLSQAVVLGLYKNVVVPDGSTIVSTLTELLATGGRGYAEIALARDIVENAPATGKWYVATDANGKASAQYGLAAAPQAWIFNAFDVADVTTVYGIFAYTWVLPFDAGAKEIKVGDTVKGAAGATGIVTAVEVQSGSWATSDAAGFLKIRSKSAAVFVENENITIQGAIATLVAAPTAAGLGYAIGDLFAITTGGEFGVGVVLTVGGGGAVATVGVAPAAPGRNYTAGAGKATSKLTGAGNDALTVEIATLATTVYAVVNIGAVGDALKKILWTEAFAAGTLIDTVGQQITYLPIFTLATA